MQKSPIIIGTRSSRLAKWQANAVLEALSEKGIEGTIHHIESTGDIDKESPLHEIGGMGLFTKTLDVALLKKSIIIGVHSLKDYPTNAHQNIIVSAVLKREDPRDVLILHPNKPEVVSEKDVQILATGSVRRKAQWLNKFPNTEIKGLRGNVPTRLQKLEDSNWDGIILASAGLKRLKISPPKIVPLEWMIPAPAQGIVGITSLKDDPVTIKLLKKINHKESDICGSAERLFMSSFESGCSVPIGALATLENGYVHMRCCISKPGGKISLHLNFNSEVNNYKENLLDWVKYLKQDIIKVGWWRDDE